MKEVEVLLGYYKVNITAYHPQTDGLVERYNRTLKAMLAKTVERCGPEWDEQLPYVLFAYRVSQQASTGESPFFLLYGRDPRLPVPDMLSPRKTQIVINLKAYGTDLYAKMSQACVGRAQKRQKMANDKDTREAPFKEGERVFLFKPAEQTGEARKLARPFHWPYRLLEMQTNTAKIVRVDHPEKEPLLVSLSRLRRCPPEIGDEVWPPDRRKRAPRSRPNTVVAGNLTSDVVDSEEPDGGELFPLDSTRDVPETEGQDKEAEEDIASSSPEATLPTDEPQFGTVTEVPAMSPDDTVASHSPSQEPSGMPDKGPGNEVDQYLSRPVAGRWAGRLRRRAGSSRRGWLDFQQGEM